MIFSDEHVAALKKYDFYQKNRLDGINDGLRTVKVLGEYQREIPLVSVIVTTYKRPQFLKSALESIIRQKFKDYEIIVVDNECADIAEDTDTQKLIKEMDNPKIIYFRNLEPMKGRMDRGASLARSEWICFLHDDDMLAANHLDTMVPIVKEHPEINFLSCDYRIFRGNEIEKIKTNGYIANNRHDGYCRESILQQSVFFNQGSWIGGLIKRVLYEDMGGMPDISTGCSDQIMCSKIIYYYSGFYRLNVPLCFYRISESQISSNKDNWFNTFISDYFFSRYAIAKITDAPNLDYEQLCLAFARKEMRAAEKTWGIKFDYNLFLKKCGIMRVEDDDEMINQNIEIWEMYEKKIIQEKGKEFKISIEKIAKNPY